MGGVAGARWQSAAQLHLTLRFIGDVSRMISPSPCPAPSGNCHHSPCPASAISRGAACPMRHGVQANPQPLLAQLHRKFDRICQQGWSRRGPTYLPHITVARLPRHTGPIAHGSACMPTSLLPRHVVSGATSSKAASLRMAAIMRNWRRHGLPEQAAPPAPPKSRFPENLHQYLERDHAGSARRIDTASPLPPVHRRLP